MSRPDPHPNVLVIVADDHQADAIGALGHRDVRTPVLDALVREGTAFTGARIMGGLMAAVCAPSRACLLTGRNVFRADATPALVDGPEYEVAIPADACTLPEWFRRAGYETFVTGKWHNDVPALLRSFESGRNIFHGGMSAHTAVPVRDLDDFRRGRPARLAAGFSSEIFADTTAAFLRQRSRGRPFFGWLAFTSPHDPRTPPPPFRALYEPERLTLPPNFRPAHPFDNGELDIRDERLLPRPLEPGALRAELADYYGMISHHDACIGRVLAALAETGAAGSTLVVYVSDHGLALGRHGLLGKQNLYEPSVRVPLVFRGGGVPRGQQREALAYSFDMYATLCELANLAAPPGLDSRSLVAAMAAGAGPVRDEVASLYMSNQRMITDGRWKLILYRVAGGERLQLFDLASDPHELRDLAAEPAHAGVLRELARRLGAWQEQVGDRWMERPVAACPADASRPR